MASFLNFFSEASSIVSEVLGVFGDGGSTGGIFTLSGGTETVVFPVNPPSFDVSNGYKHAVVNIQNLGDINLLGKRGLASIKFSSFFPANDYDFVQLLSVQSPYAYVESIKKMAEASQPCNLSITGTDISTPVTIDGFDFGEKDGTGDVYFSLNLREYRYVLPASSLTSAVTELKSRVANTVENKATTVLGVSQADLDTAQRAVQKTTSIINQGKRALGIYKAMVKSGGVKPGVVLNTMQAGVMANGEWLKKF
jgi:hypothetical protein